MAKEIFVAGVSHSPIPTHLPNSKWKEPFKLADSHQLPTQTLQGQRFEKRFTAESYEGILNESSGSSMDKFATGFN